RETQRCQQAANDRQSPSRANGHQEKRPIDILEMLSKAKDEYERNQITDSTISSPGLQPGARLTNPGSAEETSEETSPGLQMQEKPVPSGHKHLTVEELFGTSLPKEQPTIVYPNSEGVEKLPADTSPKEYDLFSPFSFESSRGAHQPENPLVQPGSPSVVQQEAPTPDRKSSSGCVVPRSPLVKATPVTESLAVKKAASQRSPLLAQPTPELRHKACHLIASQNQFVAPLNSTSPGSTSSASLLHKLQLTPQPSALPKNSIAPHFTSSASQLATPESFREPHARRKGAMATLSIAGRSPLKVGAREADPGLGILPEVFGGSLPKARALLVTFVPATTPASSVLMSPSVFQQSATKAAELEKKAGSPCRPGSTSENPAKPPLVLSRSQLQDTLIHLIKNDASFLSTLHEVYLQVLTKNINNLQL
uniref:mRNA-decapping enzyme C-terminal domain-containing protein n=1 Tax=Sarcophilus harrisii TaxID=9305 RepID=G3WXX8_SARHA